MIINKWYRRTNLLVLSTTLFDGCTIKVLKNRIVVKNPVFTVEFYPSEFDSEGTLIRVTRKGSAYTYSGFAHKHTDTRSMLEDCLNSHKGGTK